MTKHAESATQDETGRRLTIVEITPAMIEAAEAAMRAWHPDYASWREGAETILRAGLGAMEAST